MAIEQPDHYPKLRRSSMELLPTIVFASGVIATITSIALFAIKIIATSRYIHTTAYYPIPLVITWGTSLVIFSINFILTEVKRTAYPYPRPIQVDLPPELSPSFTEIAGLLSSTIDEFIYSLQEMTEASLEEANPDLRSHGRANTAALTHTLNAIKKQLLEDMICTGVLSITKDGLSIEKGIRAQILKELNGALLQERIQYLSNENPLEKAEIANRVQQIKMQIAEIEPYQECNYMQKCNPLHPANNGYLKGALLSFANSLRDQLLKEKIVINDFSLPISYLDSPLLQNAAAPFIPNEETLLSYLNHALDLSLLRIGNANPALNTARTFRTDASSAPLFELFERQTRALLSFILCASAHGGGFYRATLMKELRPALTQFEARLRGLATKKEDITPQEFLSLFSTRESPLLLIKNSLIEARRTSVNAIALLLLFSALLTLTPSFFSSRIFTVTSLSLGATTLTLALSGLLENYRERHKKFLFTHLAPLPPKEAIPLQVFDEINLELTKLQETFNSTIDAAVQRLSQPLEAAPPPSQRVQKLKKSLTLSVRNLKKKSFRTHSLTEKVTVAKEHDPISDKVTSIKFAIQCLIEKLQKELQIIKENQTLQDVLLCEKPFYRKYYEDYAQFLREKILYERKTKNRPDELARLASALHKSVENLERNVIERFMPNHIESLNFLKIIPYRIALLLKALPDTLNKPLKELVGERKIEHTSGIKKSIARVTQGVSKALLPRTITLHTLLNTGEFAGKIEDAALQKIKKKLHTIGSNKIEEQFKEIKQSTLYQEMGLLSLGNEIIAIIDEVEELAGLLLPPFLEHIVGNYRSRSALMRAISDHKMKSEMEQLIPDWLEADAHNEFVKSVAATVKAQQSVVIKEEELISLYEEFAHKEMEFFPERNPELARDVADRFLHDKDPTLEMVESLMHSILQVDKIINEHAAIKLPPPTYDLSYEEVMTLSTKLNLFGN